MVKIYKKTVAFCERLFYYITEKEKNGNKRIKCNQKVRPVPKLEFFPIWCLSPDWKGEKMRKRLINVRSKAGMEMVQVGILIAIAVAVGLIFKTEITDFVNGTFEGLSSF